ncbi:MAG: phytase [Steroidobacteraceae bacterium]
MRKPLAFAICALATAACGSQPPAAPAAPPATPPTVVAAARAETAASPQNDGNDVAFWLNPADAARSLVLGTGGTAGLELFDFGGSRVGAFTTLEPDFVAVTYGFPLGAAASGDATAGLVVVADRASGALVALAIDPATLAVRRVSPEPMRVQGEVTGLCTYRSPDTGQHYAFATVEGVVQQWQLVAQQGVVRGRLVRSIPVGVGAGYCAVDDASRTLFVAEEKVGIWRFAAEPETDAEREAVDLVAPNGHIEKEVKGLGVYRADASSAYLLAADIAAARYNVYAVGDGRLLGSFRIGAATTIDEVGESEGLAAVAFPLAGSKGGLVATFDEENDDGGGNIKLAAWDDIAAGLGLASATGIDPREPPAPTARTVMPVAETVPTGTYGDAADDPAIWVHPTDPGKSLVIGTNKKRGLDVYDLTGRRLQSLPDGRMNNVDLREGFVLGGKPVALVAASNRTTQGIALYRVDAAARRLVDVADGVIATGLTDPYGLCMYRSAKSGDTYVFVNDNEDTGTMKQWRLVAAGNKVRAEAVRSFKVGSLTEGCVADDATGALYVSEEDVAVWRYSAEPDGGDARRAIGKVGPGALTDDAEGISLWAGPNGTGYLVLSNQGADNYAVFRREGDNAFVGFFSVVANDALGIDGASETDGLDVTSAPLGPKFPHGLLVVQDGRNITPSESQNFKFVSWEAVERALGLH